MQLERSPKEDLGSAHEVNHSRLQLEMHDDARVHPL